jgi:hypothetical protein
MMMGVRSSLTPSLSLISLPNSPLLPPLNITHITHNTLQLELTMRLNADGALTVVVASGKDGRVLKQATVRPPPPQPSN